MGETEATTESEKANETEEQAEDREAAKDSDEESAKEASPSGSGDEQSDEDEDSSIPEFEERDLSMNTSFTIDEDLCLSYFLKYGANQVQPGGRRVGSREMTYRPSSKTPRRGIAW